MDQENILNPQVLYIWTAPLRPYINRSKKIIRFYLALTLLLSLIIAFFGDVILLIPLWALMFIFYVFTVTPPSNVINKITHFGVETVGTNIRWEALDHFYFTKRFSYEILTLVTHPPYDYHTYLVIPNNEIKDNVIRQLSKHVVYQEEPIKTTIDKAIDWFSKLVPHEEGESEGVKNHTPIGVNPNP
ncbi:MAG: hypothetical protein ABH812_01965 [bacterium]